MKNTFFLSLSSFLPFLSALPYLLFLPYRLLLSLFLTQFSCPPFHLIVWLIDCLIDWLIDWSGGEGPPVLRHPAEGRGERGGVHPAQHSGYQVQCTAISSEQFQNWHFSWAYSLWTARLDKFLTNNYFCSIRIRTRRSLLYKVTKIIHISKEKVVNKCVFFFFYFSEQKLVILLNFSMGQLSETIYQCTYTGWPVKHRRVFLEPCKKWLVQFKLLYELYKCT